MERRGRETKTARETADGEEQEQGTRHARWHSAHAGGCKSVHCSLLLSATAAMQGGCCLACTYPPTTPRHTSTHHNSTQHSTVQYSLIAPPSIAM